MDYNTKETLLTKLKATNELINDAITFVEGLVVEDKDSVESPKPSEMQSLEEEFVEKNTAEKVEEPEEIEEETEDVEDVAEEEDDTSEEAEPAEDVEDFDDKKVAEEYSTEELVRYLKLNNVEAKFKRKSKIVELVKALYENNPNVLNELKDLHEKTEFVKPCSKLICEVDCSHCESCTTVVDCFKQQESALVDDDGLKHPMKEPYFVDEALCCCGFNCEETDEGMFKCPVCEQVYEVE